VTKGTKREWERRPTSVCCRRPLPRTIEPPRLKRRRWAATATSYMETVMNARRSWALSRYGLAIALLAAITSGLLYPGGTVLDASTSGYSFTTV
jgi:hypothetical protein